MTERSVKVYIEMVKRGFDRDMAGLAADTHAWAGELEQTGTHLDKNATSSERLRRSLHDLDGDVEHSRGGFRSWVRDLENADGRLTNVVQTSLALGPALVPLGAAAAIPIAGLTAQLGLAAAATGTIVLGFHGIGTALQALNAYQLEPTAANLEKLQKSIRGLGPDALQFVDYLHSISPALAQLRKDAQAGLLPGAEQGLRHLMNLLPQADDLLSTVAQTTGQLFAEAGDNLDDPRWRRFFQYLQDNAQPLLLDLGHTVGNFTETFANLVMAFDPLTQQWSSGLLDFSRNLRDSTANLDDSPRFQKFLDYVQTNGPRALDTLTALGGALVQVIEAAAPVGPAALEGLHLFATTIGAIADSPIGPVLIGAAVAIGTLGRSLALLRAVGLTGGKGSVVEQAIGGRLNLGSVRGAIAATRELNAAIAERQVIAQRAATAQSALIPAADKRAAVTAYAVANERVADAERTKAAAIRESIGTVGRAAAVAAGLALATTGIADKTGLANTATLGLTGSIAGPWGAAIGAGVGAAMDFAHANDAIDESLRRADAAMDTGKVDQMAASVRQLQGYLSQRADADSGILGWFHQIVDDHSVTQARDQIHFLRAAMDDTRNATGGVAGLLTTGLAPALGQTASSFDRATQSSDEFNQSIARGQELLDKRAALRAYRQALRDFNDTAKQAPDNLRKGTKAYDDVQEKLDAVARTALDAAQHLRGMDRVDFLANARKKFVAFAHDMGLSIPAARRLATQLGLLSKTAPPDPHMFDKVASGSSSAAARVQRLMKQLYLLPKDVKTIVREAGSKPTAAKIQALAFRYGVLPRDIRTLLRAVDHASATTKKAKNMAQDFAKAYHAYLRAKDDGASSKANAAKTRAAAFAKAYLAFLKAQNMTGPQVAAAKALIASFKGKNVSITADNNTGPGVAGAKRTLSLLPGDKQIHITTTHTIIDYYKTLGKKKADGDLIEYADGGMWPALGAQQPQIQANRGPAGLTWAETGAGPWEAFISGHPGKRERSRDIADQVVDRLGGQITWLADGVVMEPVPVPQLSAGAIGSTRSHSTIVVERLPRGPVPLVLDNGTTLTAHFERIADSRIDVADDHAARTGSRGGRR